MKQINILTTALFLISTNLISQTTDVVSGLSAPQGLLLNGNELYIAETWGDKISKIDITATKPTVTDVVTGVSHPSLLLLNGNDLYIAGNGENKISKIDITDTTPTPTNVVMGLGNP